MRTIQYGGAEMQALQRAAIHTHTSDGGTTVCYGDGERVLHVRHSSKRNREPAAVVYEPGGTNLFGNAFHYSDYFLPEEMQVAPAPAKARITDCTLCCYRAPSLAALAYHQLLRHQ